MRKTHIGTALVLIPITLWALLWLVPHNTVPPTSENDLSPALVPSMALATIVFTGFLMLVRALRAGAGKVGGDDEEFGAETTGIDATVLRNVLLLILLSVGSWLLMTHVGFEPAMTLLILIIMLYAGVRKPLTIGATALLMPIVLSLCAWYFFATEMPGIWR